MPTCLQHSQSYAQDEYCVYCGLPSLTYTTTYLPATVIDWYLRALRPEYCGEPGEFRPGPTNDLLCEGRKCPS